MWQPLIDFVKRPNIRFQQGKFNTRQVKDLLIGFQTP